MHCSVERRADIQLLTGQRYGRVWWNRPSTMLHREFGEIQGMRSCGQL